MAVTVLIPARNEEADIERCLRAVLGQDHPHSRMEVVLVDGGSTDDTAEVARRVLREGDVSWRIVRNPTGTTPSNLNAGLAVASGSVLCRVDARSIIPPHYVRLCSEVLDARPDVSVTGGAQVAVASQPTVRSAAIARALNNRYAMGGSRYRSGASSGPSDTVYLGAFRTLELRAAGGWHEAMLSNQDYELNRRMRKRGIVWFDERLAVEYRPRQTLIELWRQYRRFGRWKVRYWRITGDPPRRRQLVPLVLAPCVAVVATTAVLGSQRRIVNAGALTLSGVAFAALLDELGAEAPAPPRVRTVAALATVTVAGGWTYGVLRELLRGSGSMGRWAQQDSVTPAKGPVRAPRASR